MASPKVIRRMSRRAILMYAKLVTHNKGEEGYNECKVMRACLEPALMRDG